MSFTSTESIIQYLPRFINFVCVLVVLIEEILSYIYKSLQKYFKSVRTKRGSSHK